MASPPVGPVQQFPALAAYLSHYLAGQIPEEPVLNCEMPALLSDSDDDSEHDVISSFCDNETDVSDGADGTYFPSYVIPDFDRESGDLGGDLGRWDLGFGTICLHSFVHAGYYTPTISSDEQPELGEIQTPLCGNCGEKPVAWGAGKCGFRDWCQRCDDSLWSTREQWPPYPTSINFGFAVEDEGDVTRTFDGLVHRHSEACHKHA
jgi:hypothetical protein